MSITFHLFRIRKFPEEPSEGTVVFRKDETLLSGAKPAQTLVTFKNSQPDVGPEFYSSNHEMLKRVEGRLYDGREFHEFFRKNE